MPDASPTKWHLAHTAWFFETFLLTPNLAGLRGLRPGLRLSVQLLLRGRRAAAAAPERGLITRPSAAEVMAYRAHVDAAMVRLLTRLPTGAHPRLDLGLAHEEQHQELILMDMLHLFAQSPLLAGLSRRRRRQRPRRTRSLARLRRRPGRDRRRRPGFAFDNETPRHKVYLQPFALADRLVTNGEWLAFMADGGYRQTRPLALRRLGRRQAQGWTAPLYWRQDETAGRS
jgi:formylglycine-generating enzyme required for sulfatase activity